MGKIRPFRATEEWHFTCLCGEEIETTNAEGKCPNCGINYAVGRRPQPKPPVKASEAAKTPGS